MSTVSSINERSSSQSRRALLAERLRHKAEQSTDHALSFAQQRLWFLDQLEPNTPLYNLPAVVRLSGSLNVDALQQALTAMELRHEILRTCLVRIDDLPVQRVEPKAVMRLSQAQVTGDTDLDRETEDQRWIRDEIRRPFDLEAPRLWRAALLRIEPEEHILIINQHHLIADEWSLKIFFRELIALYEGYRQGRPIDLPPLPLQYADYAAWQRQWLQGERLQEQLGYWMRHLAGQPPVTEWPTDRPRGRTPTFCGQYRTHVLSGELMASIRQVAQQEDVTLFALLLAAFKTLLHRYTGQTDLIVGTPIAGRNRAEIEGLLGFFVNTLPLRTSLEGDPTFRELLRRVREVTLGAYTHPDVPLDQLVQALQPDRSLDHLPFTRVMFVLQSDVLERMSLPGLSLRFLDVESDTAKFDFTLFAQEAHRGLVLRIEFNCDLFEPDTISRWLQHFEVLLQGMVENPARRLSQLPILPAAERHQIIEDWNCTESEYPRRRCLHQLFEAQAAGTPKAVAVRFDGEALTYAELNTRANRLAHCLRRLGVGPDVPVGICLSRSARFIVGVLGILKAGGAYVPLDPDYPPQRLAFMLADTQAPVLLTEHALLPRLPKSNAKILCLDADVQEFGGASRDNPPSQTTPENLAYIMYTSGSTGQPKGVAVPHRAVSRLVLNTNYIQFDPSDRVAQVSNISFDAATFEIWGALLNGGQLIGIAQEVTLAPREFARALQEQAITAMFLTTAWFNHLANEVPGTFENMRTLIVGGEALDPKWVRRVLQFRPPKNLVNGYGPTENTTFTCCHRVRELDEQATHVPIGRPISNTQVFLLDRHMNPVPIGVPGELYAGGDGVARGYWNRPELTAEKFVPNPFAAAGSPDRLYRTGDLARFLRDGTIEFLGRIDHQVKVRGFRIELGEIEAALGLHPAIQEVVVAVCGQAADRSLVAYFVSRTPELPHADELRRFLEAKLPEYMIPGWFVLLKSLPLTPNGKIDRLALPQPGRARPELEEKCVAPRDEVERRLVAIWEDVLGIRPVGIQDKFFDLGGHSLLAVRLSGQIERAFGRRLRLAAIFQAPTVAQLAAILRDEAPAPGEKDGTSLVEIQPRGSRPPLFCVHGAGGGLFWGYANLSRYLGPDQPVYGFKSRGLDGQRELASIPEMARHYIADLRRIQPEGPYYLCGYCFGGIVAYEMARQLHDQGGQIALLALLNCSPPNSAYNRPGWTPLWGARLLRNLLYWTCYSMQWSPSQRREFVRWKWSLFTRRVARRLAVHAGASAQIDAGDLVDLSVFSPEERAVWEAHIRALSAFDPQPWFGRVHLFRSPGHPLWCSFDPQYGWGALALGGVEVVVVPGAHEKILEPPCVEVLAGELALALTEAQQASPKSSEKGSLPDAQTQLTLSIAYWKQQLAGAPLLFELPADHPRPARQPAAVQRHAFELPQTCATALVDLCRQPGSTPLVVGLAAFATLLFRYTGCADLLVGTPLPIQNHPQASSVSGRNLTWVVLRCDLSGQPTFRQLLQRLGTTLQGAVANGSLPFERLLDELAVPPSVNSAPIFQVAFQLEDDSPLAADSAGSGVVSGTDAATPMLDLTLRLRRSATGWNGWVEYNSALFEPDRITRFVQHFLTLLSGALANPEERVSALPLLTAAERHQLLEEWTHTASEYPRDQTLVDLFLAQARLCPQAEALVSPSARLTYRQLACAASLVAKRLHALGVGKETRVGLCLERSWAMVAGLLGTLQAGAAYVPLDPAYPAERLRFMLQDAGVRVVLTQRHWLNPRAEAGFWPEATLPLYVEDLRLERVLEGSLEESEPGVESASLPQAGDLAYIIYTSGSTGRPKGVALEHRGGVALVSWARQVYSPQELAGVLAGTSICFDLSVFELFAPLCSGGKVILADNVLGLAGLGAAQEVRLINTVPSAMRELLRLKAVPGSVGVINLAGEALGPELVEELYNQTGVKRVYDLYGPTETTTYSTWALRRPGEPARIGRPLANEQVYVLDAERQLVPVGVVGELYIGGEKLARGYWGQEELTAQRFVAHPFIGGQRLYRTGDLGRWDSQGRLEYVGRSDQQVKVRGYRVELGEVEAALKSLAGVREAVVEKRGEALVGYVVGEASEEELRKQLEQRLPGHMVPGQMVKLAQLPLTVNGKVDRKALRESQPAINPSDTFVEPRNNLEKQLAAIWGEVLSMDRVGVRDNFFERGGHSLLAAQIVARVRDVFQVELPLVGLFEAPTIECMAQGIAAGKWLQDRPADPPLQPLPREGKLPVSFVQERLWFLHQLEPDSCAYHIPVALRLSGHLNRAALERAFDVVFARHEALRTTLDYVEGELVQVISPHKPFVLAEPISGGAHSEWLSAVAQRPFDLARGPLARVELARVSETDHLLLVVLHHTIADGWSLGILFHELQLSYAAFAAGTATPTLPELPIQHADFAGWHRRWMTGSLLAQELQFWQGRLAGAPTTVDLPSDELAGAPQPGQAARLQVSWPESLAMAVSQFSQRHNSTPFMVFMAALAATLRQWTGQHDLVVGTVVAGRSRREVENLIGCFMNFLPIRIQLSGLQTAADLLAHVRKTLLESQEHQDCPFERVVEAINPERKLNRNPLYNVAFLMQTFPVRPFEVNSLRTSPVEVPIPDALLDLRFEADQTAAGLTLMCEYRTELFSANTIEALLASLQQVLASLVLQPELRLDACTITPQLADQAARSRQRRDEQTIAIAATFTAEPIEEPLRYWIKDLELPAIIRFAPYHQVFQQLLDPGSLLDGNRRGLNVLLIRLSDWQPHRQPDPSAEPVNWADELRRQVELFLQALSSALARGGTPWLICLCPEAPALLADRERASRLADLEQFLVKTLESWPGLYLVTPPELTRLYPAAEAYDDPGSDALGHVPYTPAFFTALATLVARRFHALKRPPYKAIVLDCDQTLWSGVCAEDGPLGVRVDPPRVALQECMRAQHAAGRLLCLCSKNSPQDVEEVFRAHRQMGLQPEHFIARRLNWAPKSENLRSLARELNLGLDSLIFIDDNPVECAEVEANCPEVMTLLLPEDPAQIPQFLAHCWVLDQLRVTQDDRQRAQRYREERQRESLRAQSPTLAEFLAGLELNIRISPMTPDQVARVAQLTQRTNQFNFTSRRRSEAEVRNLGPSYEVLTVCVSDRFGDYGLVGVVILQTQDGVLGVDSLLLSCRVLGRRVEHKVLGHLGALACERDLNWVDLHYVQTDRNQPALHFLESVGGAFRQMREGVCVFRFPARVAAEVPRLQPQVVPSGSEVPDRPARDTTASSPGAGLARRFARCRAIALAGGDLSYIERELAIKSPARPPSSRPWVAPRTELERTLCRLWQDLLRLERVGIHDNFFEVGGHSLLAVRLFAELERVTGRKLPLITLFKAPTIEGLARLLEPSRSDAVHTLLVPIQPRGSEPPLFLVHGAGGDVLWGYANLAAHLSSQQPIYGIKSRGQAGLLEPSSLPDMARCYLQEVRGLQPSGPYYLGGYCFGGNVAYEMARQLRAEGELVALVALFDSAPCQAGYESIPWWQPGFPFRFARNLGYWLEDFRALQPLERRRFLSRKGRALGRKLRQRLRGSNGAPKVDLEEIIDTAQFPETELRLWQAHLQALIEHVDLPYSGHLTLLRTRGQPVFCSLAEDFGWSKLAKGGVSVRLVPGSHERVFTEPHVAELARQLIPFLPGSSSAERLPPPAPAVLFPSTI